MQILIRVILGLALLSGLAMAWMRLPKPTSTTYPSLSPSPSTATSMTPSPTATAVPTATPKPSPVTEVSPLPVSSPSVFVQNRARREREWDDD